MVSHSYPTLLAEIPDWAKTHKTPLHEANIRFMEFVVLSCITAHRILQQNLVLKGGNALRFAYQSPRSTKDLDFTVDAAGISDSSSQLRDLFDQAFGRTEKRFGVKAKCQRVKKNPDSVQATHPTYDLAVGYQFPRDRYFHNFEDRNVPTVIPLEISFHDLICETKMLLLIGEGRRQMRIGSLEDIIAEKLRALLQQPIRNRNRPQDVYDIASYCHKSDSDLDTAKISDYLKRKSDLRHIAVTKSSFDANVCEMAAYDYDKRIRDQAGSHFLNFDDAWTQVLDLVKSLDIPD